MLPSFGRIRSYINGCDDMDIKASLLVLWLWIWVCSYHIAAKMDRNEGCEGLEHKTAGEATGGRQEGSAGLDNPRAGAGRTSGGRNVHPTVKPTELMRYCCRLVTQPGGLILDPFAGSGSTGKAAILEGFAPVLIEREAEYWPIIDARCSYALLQRMQESATI